MLWGIAQFWSMYYDNWHRISAEGFLLENNTEIIPSRGEIETICFLFFWNCQRQGDVIEVLKFMNQVVWLDVAKIFSESGTRNTRLFLIYPMRMQEIFIYLMVTGHLQSKGQRGTWCLIWKVIFLDFLNTALDYQMRFSLKSTIKIKYCAPSLLLRKECDTQKLLQQKMGTNERWGCVYYAIGTLTAFSSMVVRYLPYPKVLADALDFLLQSRDYSHFCLEYLFSSNKC